MKPIEEYLDYILKWHEEENWGRSGVKKPGPTADEIRSIVKTSGFNFCLPESLLKVFVWAPSAGGIDFLPNYSLLSLEGALYSGRHMETRENASIRWLPILRDINDDFSGTYFVQCYTKEYPDAPIFYKEDKENGGRSKLVYESVYSLIRSTALCMKKGAYYREDDGWHKKPRLVREIIQKCNPNLRLMKKQKAEGYE